ncbi:hypothetical protein [Reyranella sp.]|uniref:hypothetical protein n=1 Tax=Reyranella sp. TaxID=1929291 RepID=UPI002F9366BE
MDLDSAKRAAIDWHDGQNHFQERFLAELGLAEASPQRTRHDANWITRAKQKEKGAWADLDWIPRYWASEPYPDGDPIWETFVMGRMYVFGTDLPRRAYDLIKKHMPHTLSLLELSRIATWVGSDMGTISAHFRDVGDCYRVDYAMDMRDAENEEVIERIRRFIGSDNPVNRADLDPHFRVGRLGVMPDMRAFGFNVVKSAAQIRGRED